MRVEHGVPETDLAHLAHVIPAMNYTLNIAFHARPLLPSPSFCVSPSFSVTLVLLIMCSYFSSLYVTQDKVDKHSLHMNGASEIKLFLNI